MWPSRTWSRIVDIDKMGDVDKMWDVDKVGDVHKGVNVKRGIYQGAGHIAEDPGSSVMGAEGRIY